MQNKLGVRHQVIEKNTAIILSTFFIPCLEDNFLQLSKLKHENIHTVFFKYTSSVNKGNRMSVEGNMDLFDVFFWRFIFVFPKFLVDL